MGRLKKKIATEKLAVEETEETQEPLNITADDLEFDEEDAKSDLLSDSSVLKNFIVDEDEEDDSQERSSKRRKLITDDKENVSPNKKKPTFVEPAPVDKTANIKKVDRIKTSLYQTLKKLGTLVSSEVGSKRVNHFEADVNCAVHLRDLQRIIKEDYTGSRQVWKLLVEWNIVQEHLLPLIVTYREYEEDVLFEAMKLLAMMTSPPKAINEKLDDEGDEFEEKTPEDEAAEERLGVKKRAKRVKQPVKNTADMTTNLDPKAQTRVLQYIKKAFIENREAIPAIMVSLSYQDKGKHYLFDKLDHRGRFVINTRFDEYAFNVVTVMCNLLMITDPEQQSASMSVPISNMHDHLLNSYKQDQALDFVLIILQEILESKASMKETISTKQWRKKWTILIVEFILQVCKFESPTKIFLETRLLDEQAEAEKQTSEAELASASSSTPKASSYKSSMLAKLLEQEKKQKEQSLNSLPGRHSRFGGYFVLKEDNSRGAITSASNILSEDAWQKELARGKVPFSRAKKPLSNNLASLERRSVVEIKQIVKNFFKDLLNSTFNRLMELITEEVQIGRITAEGEEQSTHHVRNFLTLHKFALEYNRCNNQYNLLKKGKSSKKTSEPDFPISSIVNIIKPEMCQYYMESLDFFLVQKDARTVSLIIGCIKELIRTVELVLRIDESNEAAAASRDLAIRMLHNIIYEEKYSISIVKLIKKYEPSKYPLQLLMDLAEYIHVFLRVIDYTQMEHTEQFFIKKRRRRRQQREDNIISSQDDFQDEEQEEEEEQTVNVPFSRDKFFNVQNFTTRFLHSKFVKKYIYLLKQYQTNPAAINYYAIKMLERICNESDESEMYTYSMGFFDFAFKVLNDKNVRSEVAKRKKEEVEDAVMMEVEVMKFGEFSLNEKPSIKREFTHIMVEFCNRIIRNFYNAVTSNDLRNMHLWAEVLSVKTNAFMANAYFNRTGNRKEYGKDDDEEDAEYVAETAEDAAFIDDDDNNEPSHRMETRKRGKKRSRDSMDEQEDSDE